MTLCCVLAQGVLVTSFPEEARGMVLEYFSTLNGT
jgi:hypothetical protein